MNQQVDAGGPGGGEQAMDNRLGGITGRKYSPIILSLEPDASAFEPRDRISRLKSCERADQFPRAARVSGGQLARIEAGMSHVTTAASRNTNFGKELRSPFQQGHVGSWCGFRTCNGRQKSCRASADYDDLSRAHTRRNPKN